MIKLEGSRLIWISVCLIVLCPALIVGICFSFESLRPSFINVDYLDVAGELLLLILVQFWILTIAFARLRAVTYCYLLVGFAVIALANGADLMDEFTDDPLGILNYIENIAYPLGMMIATVGLFKLSLDYRKLILKVNKDRDNWRWKANKDQLTGLFNRRYFFEIAPNLIASFKAEGAESSAALLMLDIDYFKSVNDQFGHDKGDLLLRAVGASISKFCHHDDLGFRLGGEEFGIIISAADADAIVQAAERLRQRISIAQIKTEQGELVSRTVSIGLSFLQPDDSVDGWMKRADNALYQAKHQGRNRVVIGEA